MLLLEDVFECVEKKVRARFAIVQQRNLFARKILQSLPDSHRGRRRNLAARIHHFERDLPLRTERPDAYERWFRRIAHEEFAARERRASIFYGKVKATNTLPADSMMYSLPPT